MFFIVYRNFSFFPIPFIKGTITSNARIFSKYFFVCFLPHRIPTMALWGTVGGVALVHVTDWRLILDYVPYISGKFKKDQ